MQLTTEKLAQFLKRGESTQVDFKREHYRLDAPDGKASLLKDVLAFANTPRAETAYLIFGVEETDAGYVAVGVQSEIDEARVQQTVNMNVNRAVILDCGTLRYDGHLIAYIAVAAEQRRPLYPNSDSVKGVRKHSVFVRRGSTTDLLSPDEMITMHAAALASSSASPLHAHSLKQAERWLEVFERHSLLRTQIPSILGRPYLPAARFSDGKTLATFLNDDLINQVCTLFNVQRSWIDGDGDDIYDTLPLTGPERRWMPAMIDARRRDRTAQIIAIKSDKRPLESHPDQHVCLLMSWEIAEVNGKPIEVYHPFFPYAPEWGNLKYRWAIKTILRAARAAEMFFFGHVLPAKEIIAIAQGQRFPGPLISRSPFSWHPDDYVHSLGESGQAKESADLEELVLHWRKRGFFGELGDLRAAVRGSGAELTVNEDVEC